MAAPRLQSESVYRTILAVARLLYLSERAYEAVTLTTPLLEAAEQLAQQGEQSLLSSALVHDATMRSEAGDYLSALLRYRRVLAMAYAMKDRRLLIVCVNNIGLTLQYCGLIEASLLTLNEAVRLAADDAHADARASALSNIALGCLRSDDPKRGLPAARAAINTRIPPTQLQVEQQSMIVLAMRDYVRLLLRSGRIAEAREAAERATEAAEKIGMFRPIAAAAVANALVQTYSGQAEQGIQAILDVMNHVEARAETHRDMLETLMEAYTRSTSTATSTSTSRRGHWPTSTPN
jgi:tetratricopeptide (TPR) repeat protein